MKKIILSTMALIFAVAAMAQDVNSKYTEAVEAFKVKKYDVAAKAFEQVISLGGDVASAEAKVTTAKTYLPKCYFSLSLAAARTKNFDSAIINATKSAELAELYGDMGDMTKAKGLIGSLYKAQGGAAFNNKDYAAALPVFEKGYAMDPRNVEMANWLGICYCETGDLEKGMNVFAKVAKMGPMNPTKYGPNAEKAKANMSLYINNAVAGLQGKKDYDGIISMTDQLLSQQPDSQILSFVRLQAYSDKKDYDKVIETAEATAKLQSTPEEVSNVYFILAAAYNAKEMKPQAIAAFKKVTSGANAETAKSKITELTTPAK